MGSGTQAPLLMSDLATPVHDGEAPGVRGFRVLVLFSMSVLTHRVGRPLELADPHHHGAARRAGIVPQLQIQLLACAVGKMIMV